MLSRGEKITVAALAGSFFAGSFVGNYVIGSAVIRPDSEPVAVGTSSATPTAPPVRPSSSPSSQEPDPNPSSSSPSTSADQKPIEVSVGSLVGDSITYGYYPTFLMEELRSDGYKVELVGDTKNVGEPNYPNCGHGGKNTLWIKDNLHNCLNEKANFAVIMAGTNNMNQSVKTSMADMRELIDEAYTLQPRVKLFVCSILPMLREVDRPDRVAAYNRELKKLADESRGKITFIDVNKAITAGWEDLSDGIHPTPEAAKKMAKIIKAPLEAYFSQ